MSVENCKYEKSMITAEYQRRKLEFLMDYYKAFYKRKKQWDSDNDTKSGIDIWGSKNAWDVFKKNDSKVLLEWYILIKDFVNHEQTLRWGKYRRCRF